MNENRNFVIAILLSALVLFGWTLLGDKLFPKPKAPPVTATAPAAATGAPAIPAVAKPLDVNSVLAQGGRVQIETPKVKGSINLKGARFDDLILPRHTVSLDPKSGPVRILSPSGTEHSQFAGFGWTGSGAAFPNTDTIWQSSAPKLTPESPVTLSWDNGQGQIFQIKLSVDQDYMFTAEQSVINKGAAPVAVRPYGYINRGYATVGKTSTLAGPRHDVDSWTIHVGPIGTFNNATNYDVNYPDLDEAGANGPRFKSTGGWLGFGDTYWLTAMAPSQKATMDAGFRKGNDTYQADYALDNVVVAPGQSNSVTTHFFAGAKEVPVLDGYMDKLGIQQFGNAIDWGWFKMFAKPIFYLLDNLFKLVKNFGVAIILLTLTVKLVMFPIAQRQFASMAAMRVVQPKVKEIQERYKDDRPKMQQAMMELYQKEKINPMAGCLPIFIQIPVFYALYKVLLLTIEMRHQPFALWIKDLSAPDPLTPVNLFGLLPFTPPSFIALGVLPILLGITMYAQFKLNPAPADPVQQQVFSIMPWIMMFLMAPFAAGLQLYWVVNNLLTIAQQKWLYSRHPAMKEPAKA
ncbi:MAG: membrane protein insertase YidC [Alphaproteobacteria bacterium]|nr:membrane protein insertase YidC [Alphaproteobacteria bacterium]